MSEPSRPLVQCGWVPPGLAPDTGVLVRVTEAGLAADTGIPVSTIEAGLAPDTGVLVRTT